MPATIRLPWGLQRRLETASVNFLQSRETHRVEFSRPEGEEALVRPNSVSWRIFKNPISLFIGGVAAVILELAEPAVRSGVWEHSTFRSDPLSRLRRTGLAAMVTVYGARSIAEPMIARIVRMHSNVAGATPDGGVYAANDPRLLTWVHTTAAFGFAEAYNRYVEPLSQSDFDSLYREGTAAAQLYGAAQSPQSQRSALTLFDSMLGELQASDIVFRFLQIMRDTPAFPKPFLWMQPIMVRAAVDIVPDRIRAVLRLTETYGLRRQDRWIAKMSGSTANRIVLKESPASQSCLRLGLPANYLYR
jgi:uncharacterized protein (DUF2236 family)